MGSQVVEPPLLGHSQGRLKERDDMGHRRKKARKEVRARKSSDSSSSREGAWGHCLQGFIESIGREGCEKELGGGVSKSISVPGSNSVPGSGCRNCGLDPLLSFSHPQCGRF